MTRNNRKKKTNVLKLQHDFPSSIIYFLTTVVHKVGILGTVVIVFLYLILKSTNEQQKQIVDTWILLKSDCVDQSIGIKIIFFMGVLFIIQQYYYIRKRKLDKTEIDRLSSLKSQYQETKIGKGLHHT